MIYSGEYRSYLLYQVEEKDGVDINASSGSRYIRNSVLVFKQGGDIKIGEEWCSCESVQEAQKKIDAEKTHMTEQLRQAAERSVFIEGQRIHDADKKRESRDLSEFAKRY